MTFLMLANAPGSLLPVALVVLLLVGAAIVWRLMALRHAGQSRPFVGMPLIAFLTGPAIAMVYLAIYIQFGDYLIWADAREVFLPMLTLGLIAGTLVSGVIWLQGK
ncbi:hypothetical protein [Lacipirellula sp.]|uniref:hypothetical protein n=1 Tax=Lacipirellula sp. TaxID=2691419 RepID=UPI003D09999A